MSSEQSQSWSEREKKKRWNYFPIDFFHSRSFLISLISTPKPLPQRRPPLTTLSNFLSYSCSAEFVTFLSGVIIQLLSHCLVVCFLHWTVKSSEEDALFVMHTRDFHSYQGSVKWALRKHPLRKQVKMNRRETWASRWELQKSTFMQKRIKN